MFDFFFGGSTPEPKPSARHQHTRQRPHVGSDEVPSVKKKAAFTIPSSRTSASETTTRGGDVTLLRKQHQHHSTRSVVAASSFSGYAAAHRRDVEVIPSKKPLDAEHLLRRPANAEAEHSAIRARHRPNSAHEFRETEAADHGESKQAAPAAAPPPHQNDTQRSTLHTATRQIRVRSTRYEDGVTVGHIPAGSRVSLMELRGRRGHVASGNLIGWANLADKERKEVYLEPAPETLGHGDRRPAGGGSVGEMNKKRDEALSNKEKTRGSSRAVGREDGRGEGNGNRNAPVDRLDLLEAGGVPSTRDLDAERAQFRRETEALHAEEQREALRSLLSWSFRKGAATDRLVKSVDDVFVRGYQELFRDFAWRRWREIARRGILEREEFHEKYGKWVRKAEDYARRKETRSPLPSSPTSRARKTPGSASDDGGEDVRYANPLHNRDSSSIPVPVIVTAAEKEAHLETKASSRRRGHGTTATRDPAESLRERFAREAEDFEALLGIVEARHAKSIGLPGARSRSARSDNPTLRELQQITKSASKSRRRRTPSSDHDTKRRSPARPPGAKTKTKSPHSSRSPPRSGMEIRLSSTNISETRSSSTSAKQVQIISTTRRGSPIARSIGSRIRKSLEER